MQASLYLPFMTVSYARGLFPLNTLLELYLAHKRTNGATSLLNPGATQATQTFCIVSHPSLVYKWACI